MPRTLKGAPGGRLKLARSYTAGQVAVLLGVAHATAIRLIDQGEIKGFWVPGRRRDRRVLHEAVLGFVRRNPGFRYALERIIGYDPAGDFPGGTEPARPPTTTKLPAPPRSPERPRSVQRGKIPSRSHYPLKEVAYALGLSRRTVWAKVRARELFAMKASSTGPSPWRFLVPRSILLTFIARNPSYSFALGRIEGCEPWTDDDPDVRSRKEPLIPPGAPGWKGPPRGARRGGFKRGPKLPDGRQPSLTAADIAAMVEADGNTSLDSQASR
jgi:hypothetical protein